MTRTGARPLDIDVVVPTLGRASLRHLLSSLATSPSLPQHIVLVDDRPVATGPLLENPPERLADRLEVVRVGGRGPAAARNAGWRASSAVWVAFLDDDVVAPPGWYEALCRDLADLPPRVAASQARIHVPLPARRRPTDWERNVAGLERARWATADMAYRRGVLEAVGGFDERFPRAYREDADLGLRVVHAGFEIVRGRRRIVHPVRSADGRISLRLQRGNADDPFMWALHGRGWRERADAPPGRRPLHLATVGAAVASGVAGAQRRPRLAGLAAVVWVGLTADLAWRRIEPGPRTGDEVGRMVGTSVVLPFLAVWHWLRGVVGLRRRLRRPGPVPRLPAAVLFDRDGTLVHDVPYNGDPDAVQPVDGARASLDRLRALGVPTAVVSNQSGIARGLLTRDGVEDVRDRIERLLGPLGPWEICPHDTDDGCACRKPAPGLVLRACRRLGVDPRDCVVVGDIGSDMQAARAAGAAGVLVPNGATRPEEIAAAPLVARDLAEAIDLALTRPDRTPMGDRP